MFVKKLATSVVATALMSGVALAQTPAPQTPAQTQTPAPSQSSSSMTRAPNSAAVNQTAGEWRSSKIVGLAVYNDANERLGDINELMMDASGKVQKVIIGVGGFLGIGESNVAVNYDQVKFVNEPMRTSSSTSTAPATGTSTAPATGTGMAAAPATGTGMAPAPATGTGSSTVGSTTTTTTTATAGRTSVNPDHAKVSATKDQLKAMTPFKFAN